MAGKFNCLDNPISVNISDWLLNNVGFVSAGVKESDKRVKILAYQEADCATEEMQKFASDNNAVILVGISDGGANVID